MIMAKTATLPHARSLVRTAAPASKDACSASMGRRAPLADQGLHVVEAETGEPRPHWRRAGRSRLRRSICMTAVLVSPGTAFAIASSDMPKERSRPTAASRARVT